MRGAAKAVDLGKGSVGKLLFRLALPAIAAQVINVLYNMVDRMYIGHIEGIGSLALTGVGVTMPIIMAISAFAMLVAMGGAPRASILLGQGDKKGAEKLLGNSATLLVILSLILTAVILLFGKPMLLLFGASDNTLDYGWEYLSIYAIGTVFVELSLGLNAFINAEGYAKTGFFTVALGAVLNIALDPLFIFAFGMGVKGAAIATVLSQAASAVWVTVFLCGKHSFLRIKLKNLKLEWKVVLPSLALGLSPFIMQFTESVISVCFNSSLLKYGGDLAVGAMTILTSVMQFSLLPLQGLTQGAQPITGFNFGQRNLKRVERCFRILFLSCLAYSTLIWIVSIFLPKAFVLIFATDPTLVDYTVRALRVYMAGTLLFGAQIACQQTFIALGNAKISIFLAVLRKIVLLIPLIFVLPLLLPENPAFAVYLAEPIADVTAVTVTTITFFTVFRKLKRSFPAPDSEDAFIIPESKSSETEIPGAPTSIPASNQFSTELSCDGLKPSAETEILGEPTEILASDQAAISASIQFPTGLSCDGLKPYAETEILGKPTSISASDQLPNALSCEPMKCADGISVGDAFEAADQVLQKSSDFLRDPDGETGFSNETETQATLRPSKPDEP